MTRPGHRAMLDPQQVRALAKPIRFERLPHNPEAIVITTQRRAA